MSSIFFRKDGVFSFLFHFILFLVKIIWKCQHSFQKNGEHSYFATEIQASLWIAQEFMPRLHKAQYRNWHYSSERSRNLHMLYQKLRARHILGWSKCQFDKCDLNLPFFSSESLSHLSNWHYDLSFDSQFLWVQCWVARKSQPTIVMHCKSQYVLIRLLESWDQLFDVTSIYRKTC